MLHILFNITYLVNKILYEFSSFYRDGLQQLPHQASRLRFTVQACLKNSFHLKLSFTNSRPNKQCELFPILRVFRKGLINTSPKCWRHILRNPTFTGFGGALLITYGFSHFGPPLSVHCHSLAVIQKLHPNHKRLDKKFKWNHFWLYLKPYIWEFLGAISAALLVAFINIQIPNLLGNLINILSRYTNVYVKNPLDNHFFRDIGKPASALLTLYFLHSAFTFSYIYLLSRVSERMAANIRQDLFKKFLLQDMEFFDRNRSIELMNRLTIDVHDFKVSFKHFVSQGLRNVAQLIGGSISLLWISPHMAAIALASVPAVVMLMTYLGKALRRISRLSQIQQERTNAVGEEAIANIRTVRGSASEYREMELFTVESNEGTRLAEDLGYGIAIFQGLTNFFLNSLVLSTLFIGGHLMSTDSLTPGSLMAFLVAAQGIQRSLTQTSVLLGNMIRGLNAGSRIFEVYITMANFLTFHSN